MSFFIFPRELKKVKETKKIFDKMGYDLSKYDNLLVIRSRLLPIPEDVYSVDLYFKM